MKYIINSQTFYMREENDETISLIAKNCKKLLFLNRTAGLILKKSDEVTDSLNMAKQMHAKNVSIEEVEKDVIDTINLLSAYGIASIVEDANISKREIEIAGESDYRCISGFINKNINNPYNQIAVNIPSFYSVISIRERQFNNYEYNFLTYQDNEIVSDIVIGVPMAGSIFSALSINSSFFKTEMNESQVRHACKVTLNYAKDMFDDKFNKIRFHYNTGSMGILKQIYQELGFEKTCVLKNEINKSLDLEMWDKFWC